MNQEDEAFSGIEVSTLGSVVQEILGEPSLSKAMRWNL